MGSRCLANQVVALLVAGKRIAVQLMAVAGALPLDSLDKEFGMLWHLKVLASNKFRGCSKLDQFNVEQNLECMIAAAEYYSKQRLEPPGSRASWSLGTGR